MPPLSVVIMMLTVGVIEEVGSAGIIGSNRIIGGTTVTDPSQYPFFVKIDQNVVYGMGALYELNAVIGSAYVVDNSKQYSTTLVAGEVTTYSILTPTAQVRGLSSSNIPPQSAYQNYGNDLGFLYPDAPFNVTANVSKIPICSEAEEKNTNLPTKVIGVGPSVYLGHPEPLTELELEQTYVPTDVQACINATGNKVTTNDTIVCLRAKNGAGQFCPGDSGAPIFKYDPQDPKQKAICIFAFASVSENGPAACIANNALMVGTRILPYKQYINSGSSPTTKDSGGYTGFPTWPPWPPWQPTMWPSSGGAGGDYNDGDASTHNPGSSFAVKQTPYWGAAAAFTLALSVIWMAQ